MTLICFLALVYPDSSGQSSLIFFCTYISFFLHVPFQTSNLKTIPLFPRYRRFTTEAVVVIMFVLLLLVSDYYVGFVYAAHSTSGYVKRISEMTNSLMDTVISTFYQSQLLSHLQCSMIL